MFGEKLIKELFENYSSETEAVLALARTLNSQAEDSYSEPIRSIYELLQNADDSLSKRAKLYIEGEFLYFSNNGKELSSTDVRALCTLHKSSKENHFGIGFKSVFLYAEKIFIKSGSYAFKFDKEEIDSKLPWQIMPLLLNDSEKEYFKDFDQEETVFAFKINSNFIDTLKKNLKTLLEEKHYVLFFENLEEIVVEDKVIKKEIIKTPLNQNIIKQKIMVGKLYEEYILYSHKEQSIKLLMRMENYELKPFEIQDRKLFNIIPTKQKSGFPFLINANFEVKKDREGLREDRDNKNNKIFEKLGELLPLIISEFSEYYGYLNLLPDTNIVEQHLEKQYYDAFMGSYTQKLKETAFIKAQFTRKLLKISEALVDEDSFFDLKARNKYIFECYFKNIFLLKEVVSYKLTKSFKLLDKSKSREVEVTFASGEDIVKKLLELKDFDPSQDSSANNSFLVHLMDKGLLTKLSKLPIFMSNSKKMYPIHEIVFPKYTEERNIFQGLEIENLMNLEFLKFLSYPDSRENKEIELNKYELIDKSYSAKLDLVMGKLHMGIVREKEFNVLLFLYLCDNLLQIKTKEKLKNFPLLCKDGHFKSCVEARGKNEEILISTEYKEDSQLEKIGIFAKENFVADLYDLSNNRRRHRKSKLELLKCLESMGALHKLEDGNDFYKNRLGRRGEEICYELLKKEFKDREIIWENQFEESRKPYDFKLIKNDEVLFIDAKASISTRSKNFYLSKDEWNFFVKNPLNHRIYRIYIDNKKSCQIHETVRLVLNRTSNNSNLSQYQIVLPYKEGAIIFEDSISNSGVYSLEF